MTPRLSIVALLFVPVTVFANDLTLENVSPPKVSEPEEPLAKSFSIDAGARFLDQASLDWTKRQQCFTCHTNYFYLLARPAIDADVEAHRQVRGSLEKLVTKRWEEVGPRWDAEVVMTAAVLAHNDAATTGKLHSTTKAALSRMWKLQREDGGFDWLKCGWPPMESDDDYGIAIAAIAIGAAPEKYRDTPEARRGLRGLQKYLRKNPPPTLHHLGMLVWAESYGLELLSGDQRDTFVKSIRAAQKPDGGWAIATLGNWKRADGEPQDTETSDGYATGFAVYVMRRYGVAADDSQLAKGIGWLKSNQRASGRWFTRSLHSDGSHYISHAGSAVALLAIKACE